MLSGETSVGKYPVETVKTMGRIVEAAEEDMLAQGPAAADRAQQAPHAGRRGRPRGAEMGDFLGAKFLVAFTQSGDTARRLSRYRSPMPVLAFTPEPATRSSSPDLGRGDLRRAERADHRRDGRPGRRASC